MSSFAWSEGMTPPVLATLVAVAGAILGLWLTGERVRARVLVSFSAGMLLGVAAFGLLPELIADVGTAVTLALFGAGYAVLFLVNRYAYPMCPTCSHDHNHNDCTTVLHGFAAPLVASVAVHSFLDGWGVATAQAGPLGIRVAIPLAVALHKLPEGIALGGIVRASLRTRPAALAWCILAEGCTVAGGAVGLAMAPHLGTQWITYPLAVAGGCFLFLGVHALHEEWKRRGPAPAFAPALTGVAGAAVLQHGVRAFLR